MELMKKTLPAAVVCSLALAGCGQGSFTAKGKITVTGSVTAAQSDSDRSCHETGGASMTWKKGTDQGHR